MDEQTKRQLDEIESMFVQTAHRAASDGDRLTLEGLTPATLFFSGRPQRVVGHLRSADFVSLWGEGENSFAEDPPNAVLVYLEPDDDAPKDAVVVLRDPRADVGSVSYSIEVLKGSVPSARGPVSLFIVPRAAALAGLRRRRSSSAP